MVSKPRARSTLRPFFPSVGSVDLLVQVMLVSAGRGDKNIDTSGALCYQRGLNSS